MSNKDDKIEHLEAEILAARKTIAQLTKAIEELSKRTPYYQYPVYIQPYRYNYPNWTYTVGDVTYTSAVGGGGGAGFSSGGITGTTTNTFLYSGETVKRRDDDDGEAGDRAAV